MPATTAQALPKAAQAILELPGVEFLDREGADWCCHLRFGWTTEALGGGGTIIDANLKTDLSWVRRLTASNPHLTETFVDQLALQNTIAFDEKMLVEKFNMTNFLSNCCRRIQVQKHENSHFFFRMEIFTFYEFPKFSPPEFIVDLNDE